MRFRFVLLLLRSLCGWKADGGVVLFNVVNNSGLYYDNKQSLLFVTCLRFDAFFTLLLTTFDCSKESYTYAMNQELSNLSEKALIDWELVQRACNGDEEAFRVLHDKYRSKIYDLVLKIVNNPTDAEDVTIEAFGKAFKNINQYVPRYAFSSWLFKIATNNSIDYCRRKRLLQKDYEDMNGEATAKENLVTATAPDPEQQMIRDQNMQRLEQLVTTLRPQYQRLVRLRYFDELSYEEISVKLDLPMGTVKAQLFRARNMLQDLLRASTDGEFHEF